MLCERCGMDHLVDGVVTTEIPDEWCRGALVSEVTRLHTVINNQGKRHAETTDRWAKTADMEREAKEVALLQNHERLNALEWGWSIIANAGGGDWAKESKDWQEAAAKWRDQYHEILRTREKQPHEPPKPWTPYENEGIDIPKQIGPGPTERPCCVEAYARGHAVGLAHRDVDKRNCEACNPPGGMLARCDRPACGCACHHKRIGEGPTDRPCCVEAYARGYEVGKAHREV